MAAPSGVLSSVPLPNMFTATGNFLNHLPDLTLLAPHVKNHHLLMHVYKPSAELGVHLDTQSQPISQQLNKAGTE